MGVKRVRAVHKRRQLFFKVSAILLIALGAVLFVKHKKEVLVRESSQFLEGLLSRESSMTVQIGRISGKLSGSVRFEDVRVEDPTLPAGARLLFRAKDIEVRYHLLDFFAKKFGSKLHVIVHQPEVFFRPTVSLRNNRFGWLGWAREWALTKRKRVTLTLRNLKLVYGVEAREFNDIQLHYENDAFDLAFPLRHMNVFGQDITTHLHVTGQFETGILHTPDSLKGKLSTEGSVVNWSPLPWEAEFNFALTPDSLTLDSASFLGGFKVSGAMDFIQDDWATLSLKCSQYALSNLEPFVGHEAKSSLEGRLDLDARWQGRLDALNFEAYARITGGRSGKTRYRAMDLHLSGVYPSLHLSDSRILLEDGSVMRFAERDIEFADVFNHSLYKKLVSGEDQDTVVLGDWEFRRPANENQRPEFMMQRSLGEKASLHIKKYNEADEEKLDSPEDHDMEVGFEYRLKGRDSLKLEMREDEKFIGVERKMSF